MIVKSTINGVVVVEGKSDTAKLKSIFYVDTIETGGNQITWETLRLIKKTEQTRQIILCLDPDYTGEQIRRKIATVLTKPFGQCFIPRTAITGNKIGVAEAEVLAIKEAFRDYLVFDQNSQTLTFTEFLKLNLNTMAKRKAFCRKIKIAYLNQKQLFKHLNMLGYSFSELEKINENI